MKTYTVHRLIALAFHGPRPEGLDICHGNCIKTDNRPSNLRYATRSENLRDSVIMGMNRQGGRPALYPWEFLEVGDTFKTNVIARESARIICATASTKHKRTFKIGRAANDDGSWTVTRVA